MQNIYKISKYHLEQLPDSTEELEEWNNATYFQDLEEQHIKETAKEIKETAIYLLIQFQEKKTRTEKALQCLHKPRTTDLLIVSKTEGRAGEVGMDHKAHAR